MSDLAALRNQPFALLQALDARLRAARLDIAAEPGSGWSGLAFRLRNRWLVTPQSEVSEVVPVPALTRVPGAKSFLAGIANVRGVLLPVTDLAQLLDEPAQPPHRDQRLLVLNSQRIPAAFLVDAVLGYRPFQPADQRHELVGQAGAIAPWLLGAFVRDAQPWLVLSLQRLARADAFVQAGA